MEAISDEFEESIIKPDGFQGILRVIANDIKDVETFKVNLLKEVDWNNSRPMFRSKAFTYLSETIYDLKEHKKKIVTLQEIQERYEILSGSRILKSTLKFLLKNFSDSGELEYFPDILKDKVILQDPIYESNRT